MISHVSKKDFQFILDKIKDENPELYAVLSVATHEDKIIITDDETSRTLDVIQLRKDQGELGDEQTQELVEDEYIGDALIDDLSEEISRCLSLLFFKYYNISI